MRSSRDNSDPARGRWIPFLALALLLLATGAQAQAALNGLNGETLTDAQLNERPTIAVVWASWSPRCREIVQQVNALQERWGDKARVITVNFQEDAAAARAFLEGKTLNAPVYLDQDGSFSKKYAITWLPGMVVFQGGETPYKGRFSNEADRTLERFFP